MKKLLTVLTALVLLAYGASAEASGYDAYQPASERALGALEEALAAEYGSVYIYREFGDTGNHFTQKAKRWGTDESLAEDMNENWRENPAAGDSCIRCVQITREGDWGGWLFLNGWLAEGETVPRLNDGSMDGQGLDLTGAEALTFMARGEKGGEAVEFFTCGFGYDGERGEALVRYPDSEKKRSLGVKTLSREWTEYTIDLRGADLSRIVCGFGYVLSGGDAGTEENVFYLDGHSSDAPLLRYRQYLYQERGAYL